MPSKFQVGDRVEKVIPQAWAVHVSDLTNGRDDFQEFANREMAERWFNTASIAGGINAGRCVSLLRIVKQVIVPEDEE